MSHFNYVVPLSLAMVASHALGSVRDAKLTLPEAPKDALSIEASEAIDRLLSNRVVKDAVASSFDSIMTVMLDEEGVELAQKYLPPELAKMAWGYGQQDSTDVTPGAGACYTNCYSNCYSNCHGACHGSRGWR